MTKTCPACGFVSNAEARFCRMCGALLPRANEMGDSTISPHASTVPLTGADTATDALSPHDTGSPNRPRTSDLRRGEIDELLLRLSDSGSRTTTTTGDGSPPSRADDTLEDETTDDDARPLRIRVRPIEHDASTGGAQAPDIHAATATTPSNNANAESNANATPSISSSHPTDARDSSHDGNSDSISSAHLEITHDEAASSSDASTSAAQASRASSDLSRASSDLPHASSDLHRSDLHRSDSEAASSSQANSAAQANADASTRRPNEARAMRLWAGAAIFCVVAVIIAAGVVLAWYAVHKLRGASTATEGAASASVAIASPAAEDAKQTVASKLREADELTAAGRADEATARLREAAALDPSDAEPHRRLARLLLAGGSRRTAIEELQAVTRLAPDDAEAWRDLAAAQSAEGSYAAAAESYHALFGLAGGATSDDRLQLAYADALRLSGRAREAQSIYKRLANSRVGEVARASRQQLADANANESKNTNANTTQSASANANSLNNAAREARPAETPRASEASNAATQSRTSPATLPADASPRDHYERGVELWRTNRAAALVEFGAAAQHGNADADYYLGLNLAEGRDPRTLKRAELVGALGYFQSARRSRFSADARRYEDALVKEYDRRRTANDQR
jgi:hypothetical protein